MKEELCCTPVMSTGDCAGTGCWRMTGARVSKILMDRIGLGINSLERRVGVSMCMCACMCMCVYVPGELVDARLEHRCHSYP